MYYYYLTYRIYRVGVIPLCKLNNSNGVLKIQEITRQIANGNYGKVITITITFDQLKKIIGITYCHPSNYNNIRINIASVHETIDNAAVVQYYDDHSSTTRHYIYINAIGY